MKLEYDKSAMRDIRAGENIHFNKNHWPMVGNMMIPRRLWAELPQDFQTELLAEPPLDEIAGIAGRRFSVSSRCFSGSLDEYAYKESQGHYE